MTLAVDLFFSFRSPYSYLALPKTLKLVADYDATVSLRPVYPLAVRVPDFFKKTNPQFAPYAWRDASGPTPTFASHLGGTFANVGVEGPLAYLLMLVELWI